MTNSKPRITLTPKGAIALANRAGYDEVTATSDGDAWTITMSTPPFAESKRVTMQDLEREHGDAPPIPGHEAQCYRSRSIVLAVCELLNVERATEIDGE